MAQAPMAITYLGSAIWSYNLFNTGPILLTMVPAMIITSACLGVALATSNPNLEKSYLAEAVAIISIPQQLVANVRGHNEFALAQLIRSSSLLRTTPPPGASCISPGKSFILFCSVIDGFIIYCATSISMPLFCEHIKNQEKE